MDTHEDEAWIARIEDALVEVPHIPALRVSGDVFDNMLLHEREIVGVASGEYDRIHFQEGAIPKMRQAARSTLASSPSSSAKTCFKPLDAQGPFIPNGSGLTNGHLRGPSPFPAPLFFQQLPTSSQEACYFQQLPEHIFLLFFWGPVSERWTTHVQRLTFLPAELGQSQDNIVPAPAPKTDRCFPVFVASSLALPAFCCWPRGRGFGRS